VSLSTNRERQCPDILFSLTDSGASGKSPNVEDLRITYGTKTKRRTDDTYGPLLSKILRNFRADGWYPGQNADTYAWYAMAMWAQKEIGHYPEDPKSKGVKPIAAPRRADGTSLNDPAGAADSPDDSEDIELDYEPSEGFTPPNCGSRMSSSEQPLPVLNVSCVDAASAVPADVFSSATNQVYSTFCRGTVNNGNQLEWMANIFGNLTGLSPTQNSRVKRFAHLTRADGPEQFTNWQFKLDWVPDKDSFDAGQCYLDCETAFQVFAATPQCSQKGDEKNLMSLSGQIDVGCGMYGYTVKGIAIS